MPAEVFPSTIRAKGCAQATMSNWGNNFIIVRYFDIDSNIPSYRVLTCTGTYHPPDADLHRIRHLCFLCGILSASIDMGLLFHSGNYGPDFGTNGLCLQG